VTDLIRRLPVEDWPLLRLFPDQVAPKPKDCIALVAQAESGELLGRIFLLAPVHIEGLYVSPSRRGTALMSDLVEKAEQEARNLGVSTAFAYADGIQMENYIERLCYSRERWSVWRKELATCP